MQTEQEREAERVRARRRRKVAYYVLFTGAVLVIVFVVLKVLRVVEAELP